MPEEWDPDEDAGGMTVEHPADDDDDCPVAHEVASCGLGMFFVHRDDPTKTWREERVDPGRYEIEVWSERLCADGPWGPAEWDGGLRLAELDGM